VTAINTLLSSSHPSLPVFYENVLEVDASAIGTQYLQVSIDFDNAEMATVEASPSDRIGGMIVFRHVVKQGAGTRITNSLFDSLNAGMRHRILSGVRTLTPTFGKKREVAGWMGSELYVPFEYYSLN
jgi:hypothetical protein